MAAPQDKALRQVLTFRVGGAHLAAAASAVTQVFRRPRITRVPHAPPSLLGVANLGGAVTPVLSLASLLNQAEQTGTAASRILLLQLDQPLAIAVDEVGSLTAEVEAGAAAGADSDGLGPLHVIDGQARRSVDLAALLASQFSNLLGGARTSAAPRARGDAAQDRSADLAFLSFDLAGQTFAFALDEVCEALPAPPHVLEVPQRGEAMLGLIRLREDLLPVVSLDQLLGLEAAHTDKRYVLVVQLGRTRLGVMVDGLRQVLRVAPQLVGPVPLMLNRGRGEAQIHQICRVEGGGLVSILSAERLFAEETVAAVLAQDHHEGAQMSQIQDAQERERIVVFQIGDEEYGLPLEAVDEVVRLPASLTRVPRAPAFIEGVMNLRGRVVPIIDQARRFGAASHADRRRQRVIVTTIDERPAGFVVDAVSEILSLSLADVAATPDLAADGEQVFDRVVSLNDGERMILLVDPKALLDRAERDLLAALEAEPREPAP